MDGPNLTLDLAVEAELVDRLGWHVAGDPIRRVPEDALRRLLRTCHRASAAMKFAPAESVSAATAGVAALWRDQVLDVPRRTLFNAYRSLLRIGPRQYLELKRLHRLRYLLKRADSGAVTVTTLAAELGFGDMGRVAQRYRSLFGENPSETLKRARSSLA